MSKPKEGVQMRVPNKAYNLIRKEAFRRHEPMTTILEEIIIKHFERVTL